MTYQNEIMGEVTRNIKRHCTKQTCEDLKKGRKLRHNPVSAKWKHLYKLMDYQGRSFNGKAKRLK